MTSTFTVRTKPIKYKWSKDGMTLTTKIPIFDEIIKRRLSDDKHLEDEAILTRALLDLERSLLLRHGRNMNGTGYVYVANMDAEDIADYDRQPPDGHVMLMCPIQDNEIAVPVPEFERVMMQLVLRYRFLLGELFRGGR